MSRKSSQESSANAALAWTTCDGRSASAPARVYRAQNVVFSLYLEQYNGGIAGVYTNTGAVSTTQSYFWTVEWRETAAKAEARGIRAA